MGIPPRIFGMKTADLLSYARMLISVPIGYLLWKGQNMAAIWLLVAGIVSDADGTIARLTRTESESGKKIDKLADGLLMCSSALSMFLFGYIPMADFIIMAALSIPTLIRFMREKGAIDGSLAGKVIGISHYAYLISYMAGFRYSFYMMLAVSGAGFAYSLAGIFKDLNHSP